MRFNPSVLFVFVCAGLITLGGCAPSNLEERQRKAYRLYQDKEYAAAAQEFRGLVEHIPRDAELWFRLGNSYTRSQQPQRAIQAYENALLRDPRLARAWYNKGIVHLQQGLKTFVDMHEYADSSDSATKRGLHMRDRLLEILSSEAASD
ncbi:MAG: tetratricopeptide repeat protein [Thermodesulfobacteriota bacterium]